MRIGIDFDDVIFDCNGSLQLWHNRRYGTDIVPSAITAWNLHELWGCSREEAEARIDAWYVSSEHEHGVPVRGAIDALRELAQSHELYIITSRPVRVKKQTEAWLHTYAPGLFAGVHFADSGTSNVATKGDTCRALAIALFIDDALHNAIDVSNAGVSTLLFDAPWNQGDVPRGVVRVFGWSDVQKFVNAMCRIRRVV